MISGRPRGKVLQLGLAATLTGGVALALAMPGRGDPPEVTVTYAAVADALLDSTHASTAFGEQTSLRVDGTPAQESLLRFQVTGTEAISRATLRLWARSPGYGRTTVATVGSGWDERSTWEGRPAAGRSVGTVPKHPTATWVSVDVTDAVLADGPVELVLRSKGSAAERYASREDAAHAPQLVVTAAHATPRVPTGPSPGGALSGSDDGSVRAAFYYPWFPESWKQHGFSPFTAFHPTAGYYDSAQLSTIDRTLDDMTYAGLNAVISSWQGPGSLEDQRLPQLLERAALKGLRVAAYAEQEGTQDPSVAAIAGDLARIKALASSSPAYLTREGRPVLFVYAGPHDGCPMARRWKQADASHAFFLVLKVFSGYQSCDAQPDAWHQYSPAVRSVTVGTDAVSVSPGFFKKGERRPRLTRDVRAFDRAVTAMAASRATFQLITTYNEWGEGTAVESAEEWTTRSGRGAYLDVLHQRLASDPVVAAAGDIACAPSDKSFRGGSGTTGSCRQQATSGLLAGVQPDVVLPLGDTQYECGDASAFAASYGSTWGRFRDRTRPAIGNHEYGQACGRNDPSGYFDYFGSRAGTKYQGWYSYDVGSWHLIALNSECSYGRGATSVGGCSTGSAQELWLRHDLRAHPAACTLAYWHEPRFSSGQHGDAQQMADLWNDLAAARADIVLSGHNHDYERFDPLGAAPQDVTAAHASTTTGRPSFQQPVPDASGIREFIVGTGGKNHYDFAVPPLLGERVRNSDTYGVLSLTLHPTGYDWRFVPEPGKSFTDSGSGSCH